ncbi:CGNR zinc finger domain-containing protein [Streptomyces sp. NPDC052012]|uniref:CGNR zinc finger domain-containing protein n=1 Tax=Streptomyces sp. NPDC052012 TaxID=3155051 RepID=UPI0034505CD8
METPGDGPGLTLVSHQGTPYRFDPGALCLELLPTGGPGALARFEVLHAPADLVAWAGRSRLAEGLDLTVDEGELERARALRDALFRLAADRAHGRPLRAGDLDHVNAAAAEPPLVSRMGADGTRSWARGATGTQLLSTVARDAIDLFTGPYADRIRECGAHDCRLLFVDTSRPGRRRWCAMEHCGNREKVRAHRARRAPRAGA